MAFESFWGFVKSDPAEALQVAAAIGSFMFATITVVGTGTWWLSNSLTKSKLEILDERIKLAGDRESDLIKKLNALQTEIAKMPQTPELDKKSQELDFLKDELAVARRGVSQAFGVVEGTVGGVLDVFKNRFFAK